MSTLYCDDCDTIKPVLYCRDCGWDYLTGKHTQECEENDEPSLEYVCEGCLPRRVTPRREPS